MVGRASVTRELGSPATPVAGLVSKHSRRSSSRASQRRTQEPELNQSSLPYSSYSLPPTPITSSFDEIQPSTKRRRTQRVIDSEDKTLSFKGATETPTHRAFSEPSHISNRHNPSSKSTLSNFVQHRSQSPKVHTAPNDRAVTLSTSSSNLAPVTTPEDQTNQDILSSRKPSSRRKTIAIKSEPTDRNKDTSTTSSATMGAAMSHSRKTRKSITIGLERPVSQENGTTPSKAPTSLSSTPQSSRRDRRSRLAANTGAKITKQSPGAKALSTPTASARTSKTENDGANKTATPAKQQPFTPNNSTTRSRRRDRKPTRAAATEQTPNSNQAENTGPVTEMKADERPRSQRPSKLSNTVTLNVGRKSLEALLAEHPEKSHNNETTNNLEETPAQANGDYHFEYDTDMYKNNFGLDGQMDTPTSPTSFSTTTSNAARTSGRTRKPTIRALESFESEQRFRRPHATSVKPTSTTADGAAGVKTRSRQKPGRQPPTSVSKAAHPDVEILAKKIYELTSAAIAADFEPAPEAEAWLKDLQQKIDEKRKQKEAGLSQSVEVEAGGEGESMPSSSKTPFSDNVRVSDPWTDGDGWTYTGQANKHGEEYVVAPLNFEWYRPNNTYNDKELPLPPVRIRSYAQAEKDRIFGYPPLMGQRNIPRDNNGIFLLENVPEEKTKLKAREAARERGILVDRFMPLAEIESLINQHDTGHPPVPVTVTDNIPAVKAKEPTRKRHRTENTSATTKSEPTDAPRPKRRRQRAETAAPTSAPSEPEPEPVPEASATEPASEEKPSLKIKLTFGKYILPTDEAMASGANAADQSKKRPHSDIEENTSETTHTYDTRSPQIQKPINTDAPDDAAQSAAAPPTPVRSAELKPNNPDATQNSPTLADHSPTETPGGRPRRRAAAALMAGFQNHAEERARRANARKKGTPLKNVINGDTVDTPIRPSADPMSLD